VSEAPIPDVRDEALALTRRYWTRHLADGGENTSLLWEWDRFRRRMMEATIDLDVIVTPATDGAAPAWREVEDVDFVWQLPWSLTGAPAAVIPVADDADGMPLAAHFVAQPWQEHVALAAAKTVESLLPR
jgi:Asp-tRNA(Asn)/Glu-tRNA(Gln) amidotransferase A subunit family amidase